MALTSLPPQAQARERAQTLTPAVRKVNARCQGVPNPLVSTRCVRTMRHTGMKTQGARSRIAQVAPHPRPHHLVVATHQAPAQPATHRARARARHPTCALPHTRVRDERPGICRRGVGGGGDRRAQTRLETPVSASLAGVWLVHAAVGSHALSGPPGRVPRRPHLLTASLPQVLG